MGSITKKLAEQAETVSENTAPVQDNAAPATPAAPASKGGFKFAIVKDWTPPATARKKGQGGGTQKYHWEEFSEVGMAAPVENVSPNVIRKSISKFLAKQREENLKAFLTASKPALDDYAAKIAAEGYTPAEGEEPVTIETLTAKFDNPEGWLFEVYSMGRNEDKTWKGVHVLRNR